MTTVSRGWIRRTRAQSPPSPCAPTSQTCSTSGSWSSPGWYSEEEGQGPAASTATPGSRWARTWRQDTTQKLRKASQSSTWTNGTPTGDAYRALDGNTDGVYTDKSVTATNSEYQPWWQVDMGGLQWIDAIQIWNRIDSCCRGPDEGLLRVDDADGLPEG